MIKGSKKIMVHIRVGLYDKSIYIFPMCKDSKKLKEFDFLNEGTNQGVPIQKKYTL